MQKESKRKTNTYMNLIPPNIQVEGEMEFPLLNPYKGDLPKYVSGMDEPIPSQSKWIGMHGFCYDNVLESKCHNFYKLVEKASHYLCAFAPDFSIFLDGKRCDAISAIRKNRYIALGMQLRGIPTIQTASISNVNFFDFVYDGLASHCRVAIENNIQKKIRDREKLIQISIEELIRKKSPSVLLVVGFPLNFDPGIPVVVYESRIQKFRKYEIPKNN